MQHDIWLVTSPTSTQNITKGLIIVWHAGYSSWSIHYFKADTLHSPTIHLYQTALVKSCSLVKIKIPYPVPFPSRSSHPDPLKTQNPAPALYWNSRFPLLFSAHIQNIAKKISQIPHPAKPIVDPLTCPGEFFSLACFAHLLSKL